METVKDAYPGESVYLRARNTRRAAIGSVCIVVPATNTCVVELRTDWYDWDEIGKEPKRRMPHAGETLTVKGTWMEAVRG